MPRGQRMSNDLHFRAYEYIGRNVNEAVELVYLRAGADPEWQRPKENGEDITDQPERWTPHQRAMRLAYEERVRGYRSEGRI